MDVTAALDVDGFCCSCLWTDGLWLLFTFSRTDSERTSVDEEVFEVDVADDNIDGDKVVATIDDDDDIVDDDEDRGIPRFAA